MIEFPCHCGYRFSLPEDLGGSLIQCPKCKRLVDIPLPGEMDQMEADGTIKLQPEPEPVEEHRIDELKRAFSRSKVDDDGEEYDLRPTMEDVLNAGADNVPLELKDELRPGPPKYDPETGELIRPLDVKEEVRQPVLVPKGPPTLQYANTPAGPASPVEASRGLLGVGSLVVLTMVFGLHLLVTAVMIPVGMGMFFMTFLAFLFSATILAHYTNVIEEIGIFEKDELPTPLRGASWFEDLLVPCWHFFLAGLLCYLPAFIALPNYVVAAALAAVGTFFFPAVLLTSTASGSIMNLRPDRVLGVISECRGNYVLAVVSWIVVIAANIAGLTATMGYAFNMGRRLVSFMGMPGGGAGGPVWQSPLIAYSLLVVAIYLTHLFCWHLGLIYRRYHENFPWILQRHTPRKKIERVTRRRPRYADARAAASATGVPRPVEPIPSEPLPVEPVRAEAVPAQPLRVQNVEAAEDPLAPLPLEPLPAEEIDDDRRSRA